MSWEWHPEGLTNEPSQAEQPVLSHHCGNNTQSFGTSALSLRKARKEQYLPVNLTPLTAHVSLGRSACTAPGNKCKRERKCGAGLYALHSSTSTAPEREQGRKHTAPEVIHVLLYTPAAPLKHSGVARTAEQGFQRVHSSPPDLRSS